MSPFQNYPNLISIHFSSQNCHRFKIILILWISILISKLSLFQNYFNLMNIHFHLKIVPASKLSQSYEYSFSSQNCPRFKIFSTLWLFILISKLSQFQNNPNLISIPFSSQNCPQLKIILILWIFILISKLSPFQNYFNLMNIHFHLKIVPASKLSQSN